MGERSQVRLLDAGDYAGSRGGERHLKAWRDRAQEILLRGITENGYVRRCSVCDQGKLIEEAGGNRYSFAFPFIASQRS